MSAIEWTDETWSPIVGCTRVSAGSTLALAVICALFSTRILAQPTQLDWTLLRRDYEIGVVYDDPNPSLRIEDLARLRARDPFSQVYIFGFLAFLHGRPPGRRGEPPPAVTAAWGGGTGHVASLRRALPGPLPVAECRLETATAKPPPRTRPSDQPAAANEQLSLELPFHIKTRPQVVAASRRARPSR